MSKELENQIRDLQKELAETKKNQAVLRLQALLSTFFCDVLVQYSTIRQVRPHYP